MIFQIAYAIIFLYYSDYIKRNGDVKVAKSKSIRVVELFAGVGGFRLGFERCAVDVFKTIWANQWEPNQAGQWAYKCYTAQFGEKANCINADIATIIEQVPEHDLLVGGFPCQDYSVANSLSSAKGIEGKKGVLWWSINDIIKARHPQYILLENVDRLLKSPASQRGRDFGIILKCLSDEGYSVEWRVINAADYGNVQRRRRTFIFACNSSTKFYKNISKHLFATGCSSWLKTEGFFAKGFPVDIAYNAPDKRSSINLNSYSDLIDVSQNFKSAFYNSGVMLNGIVYSEELTPYYQGNQLTLSDIISKEPVSERYFIAEKDLPKWEYMKGAKRLTRTSKEGYEYQFSEGAIAFPDPLNRPARTMLTSEGSKNRSSHVIEDWTTKRLRILTPEECERINGFDTGWTNTGMPERQRYFIMGNALVVPLIEQMGKTLLEIT